jgi:hypothetical protein
MTLFVLLMLMYHMGALNFFTFVGAVCLWIARNAWCAK